MNSSSVAVAVRGSWRHCAGAARASRSWVRRGYEARPPAIQLRLRPPSKQACVRCPARALAPGPSAHGFFRRFAHHAKNLHAAALFFPTSSPAKGATGERDLANAAPSTWRQFTISRAKRASELDYGQNFVKAGRASAARGGDGSAGRSHRLKRSLIQLEVPG